MLLTIIRKELLLTTRDIHALLVLFLMPTAFILIMSLSLQDTFQAAGRGHYFDHAVILSGVSDAIVAMTDGLRALRGAEDPTPPKELPIVVPPPEVPDEDTVPEEPIPGGLLSV